jgi:hypothetical protein
VAITIGQLTSYKILRSKKVPQNVEKAALLFIVLLALALILFTFYPPHLPIFQDPTGIYGLP